MESPSEDNEITFLRQSKKFLRELGEAFEHVEDVKNERELDSIIRKLEPYQEDPQLLDSELGKFIPLLSDRFLHHLQDELLLQHLSKILYTFCKIRGEKVIVGLLNNEPRWIEPLLDVVASDDLPWEQNYILLLWLSHLMLSPFDLATISSFQADSESNSILLPDDTPSIASEVVQIGLQHLSAPTIERKAAAQLLVRLCIRQDMLQLGLLGLIANWAITECARAATDTTIHASLGTLYFLANLVASSDQKMLGVQLSSIFNLSIKILEEDELKNIRSSAVARKLTIKILRHTVLHCLQSPSENLDTTEVVEQVIGTSIELLADPDTPVRMAASKALSLVTLKLDSDMASEVIEALKGSFYETFDPSMRSFFSVNAARWHGITLTFGHLLHKRAIPQEHVPAVLRNILYALSFEQRSTTNKSTGSNVRDAANYGLWAIARRCTTAELSNISASSFAITDTVATESAIQYIALSLLCSACFDPDGNVRRGSSAALQELIGRHPNCVIEGINLVQVVDYQAVGLHGRACTKIALAAAELDQIYEEALADAMFSWRGIAAASLQHRTDAAVFAGLLVTNKWTKVETDVADNPQLPAVTTITSTLLTRIRISLTSLKPRDMEERQGLMLAASWIFSALTERWSHVKSGPSRASELIFTFYESVFSNLEGLGPGLSHILAPDFKARISRCDLVISAALRVLGQLAALSSILGKLAPDSSIKARRDRQILRQLFDECFTRSEDIVLDEVPGAVRLSMLMLEDVDRSELVHHWLQDLIPENKKVGVRGSARVLALGAAFSSLSSTSHVEDGVTDIRQMVLDSLLERYRYVDTDSKIVVLQSVKLILAGGVGTDEDTSARRYFNIIATMLLLALHDYTISERGDVGSLVRLAGLAALQEAWSRGILLAIKLEEREEQMNHFIAKKPDGNELRSLKLDAYDLHATLLEHLGATVRRLRLEKMDKVRLAAMECYHITTTHQSQITNGTSNPVEPTTIDTDTIRLLTHGAPLPPKPVLNHDISSTSFFLRALDGLRDSSSPKHLRLRILEGLCSTAGGAGLGASQNLVNAREALHLFLTDPNHEHEHQEVVTSLLTSIIDVNTKLENDQRLISILDVAAFLAEYALLAFVSNPSIGPSKGVSARSFLASIQRCHYKSKNIKKLQICLDVYRSLVYVEEVRDVAMKMMVNMLGHPIPAVRVAAAESVVEFFDDDIAELVIKMDWTRPVGDLGNVITKVREVLLPPA